MKLLLFSYKRLCTVPFWIRVMSTLWNFFVVYLLGEALSTFKNHQFLKKNEHVVEFLSLSCKYFCPLPFEIQVALSYSLCWFMFISAERWPIQPIDPMYHHSQCTWLVVGPTHQCRKVTHSTDWPHAPTTAHVHDWLWGQLISAERWPIQQIGPMHQPQPMYMIGCGA